MKSRGYNSTTSWIAAIVCGVVGFLIFIPLRLSGLLFVIILDAYETDRKLATLSFVFLGIIRALLGPFIGYLSELCGLRVITLIGAILSSVGVGACFFAEDITAITICLGVIYGIGFSFGVTLLNSIIALHFTKNINLANGIYLAGTCLAGTIMSPVVEHLNYTFGTSGMFLILSGIILNAVPACILLTEPKNKKKDSHCLKKGNDKIEHESFENKTIRTQDKENYSTNININISEEKDNIDSNKEQNKKKCDKQKRNNESDKNSVGSISVHGDSVTNGTEDEKADSSKKEQAQVKSLSCKAQSLQKRNLLSLESLRLFTDPTFYVTMIVQSVYAFMSTQSWTVIVDYARDKGIETSTAVNLIMFFPIAETVGSLSLNWITDRHLMSRTNFCMVCYFILGIGSAFLIWTPDFVSMMIAAMVFAFTGGALYTTFPGMVMEFIEESQQNMALASRFILYAFLTACKAPLVGYFREDLGSYDWIYCIVALLSLISGILVKFTPIMAALRTKKASTQSNKD